MLFGIARNNTMLFGIARNNILNTHRYTLKQRLKKLMLVKPIACKCA